MATDVKSIKEHDDCLMVLNESRIEHKYRYMIISSSKDLKYIIVEKTVPQEKTYDYLLNYLPKSDICYAIYHFIFFCSFIVEKNLFLYVNLPIQISDALQSVSSHYMMI